MMLRLLLMAAIAGVAAVAAPTQNGDRATAQPPAAPASFERTQAQALADARCRAMLGEGRAIFKEKVGPAWVFRTVVGPAGTPGPDISIVSLRSSSAADVRLDPQAAAQFAYFIRQSDHVSIPMYDITRQVSQAPVVVRDRAQLEELARIFARAVLQPMSHLWAVTAGGPVTFYGANARRICTLERFGQAVRLDGRDYRIDPASKTALDAWFERVERAPASAALTQ